MLEMLSAIWLQEFDVLLTMNSVHLLLLLLGIVLFLESSFVFLPLPGDGLVLFVGGLVGVGAIEFVPALVILSLAAGIGSLIAYLQGRWLDGTVFMQKAEQAIAPDVLPKAKKLLSTYGFFALFGSRFVPFVRVITPMLMGVAKLNPLRMIMTSLTSAFTWVLALLFAGSWLIQHPLLASYQAPITKGFLLFSATLMIVAFVTMMIRLLANKRQHHSDSGCAKSRNKLTCEKRSEI